MERRGDGCGDAARERAGALPETVTGLSIDSRTVARGEAFFAITGERDGHDFVGAAPACGRRARRRGARSGKRRCPRMRRFCCR